jgi:hypothetical protein
MKKEGHRLKGKLILILMLIIIIVGSIGYFYKESYCNPSGYLPTSQEGTNSQEVQNFFKNQDREVLCTGSNQFNKIFSGKTSYILCKTNSDGQYFIEITKANALKRTSAEIDKWLLNKSWEWDGQETAIFPIEIPQGVDGESLRLEIVIRKDNQLISTENLNFDIYGPEEMMNKICSI